MMTTFLLALLTTGAYAEDPAVVPATPADVPVVVTEAVPPVPAVAPVEVPATPAVATPAVTPAPAATLPEVKVPETDAQALKDVQDSVDALKMGQWGTLIVLLIGLAIFGYNKFIKKA